MPRKPRFRRLEASVAEPGVKATLPPIEFQLLEPVDGVYLGDLRELMSVVALMAAMAPKVGVSMSLCRVKDGRAFSRVGLNRRVCLVALFQLPDRPPAVLVDVEHSENHPLSTLALRYKQNQSFREIEGHVSQLLDRLVDRGGHWDVEAEIAFSGICDCQHFPRVLRRRGSFGKICYLRKWARKLCNKLDIEIEMLIGSESV